MVHHNVGADYWMFVLVITNIVLYVFLAKMNGERQNQKFSGNTFTETVVNCLFEFVLMPITVKSDLRTCQLEEGFWESCRKRGTRRYYSLNLFWNGYKE